MTATTVSQRVPAHSTTATRNRRQVDWRTRYFNWFCVSVLLVFAAIWAIPLLWAIDTSLKPDGEIALNPTHWWSSNWTFAAYRTVFGVGNIQTWYLNSFMISLLSATLSVIVCSMAGFALARTRFRGRRMLFALLAAGLLIPSQVLIVPMFKEFNAINLLNTY